MKQAVIVGAGIGGLAASIRMARAGWNVIVHEKNAGPGGKAVEKTANTAWGRFRWDCGPSLLTMPHVLEELFSHCGESLQDYLALDRVEPACRYHWTDGTVIDENEVFWNQPEVRRFLEHAKGIYELSAEAYLHLPPREWWRADKPGMLAALCHLPKVATLETLGQLNARFFQEMHQRQIFDRFATYNGSSPYRTPATFAIIPYVEATFGAWYPKGGMARLPAALHQLALKQGVKFEFNSEVRDLEQVKADVCVCNEDVITARTFGMKDPQGAASLQRKELACSGLVLWLGLRKQFPQLSHHNIFFSDDYPGEFQEIFGDKSMPSEPTIYVAITSKTDSKDAPEGCENWFVLVNAPAYSRVDIARAEEIVLRRLSKFGIEIDHEDIVYREAFGPKDFQKRDNAWEGSLYGWASHSPMTALLRPTLRHPKKRNLYFCGGTTHPGGGIPLVLLSGKMAADMATKDYPPT